MGKTDVIQRTIEQYKKLPPDKKMFVLGIMQGLLINHSENKESESEVTLKKSGT